jgi:hypothetical protein
MMSKYVSITLELQFENESQDEDWNEEEIPLELDDYVTLILIPIKEDGSFRNVLDHPISNPMVFDVDVSFTFQNPTEERLSSLNSPSIQVNRTDDHETDRERGVFDDIKINILLIRS